VVSKERPDTEQTAIAEPVTGPRPLHDPQAVQVEGSGISAAESMRRRRMRNLALALALGAFVVLIFVITLVKLGTGVMNRPL
jgi:hypothetical protein